MGWVTATRIQVLALVTGLCTAVISPQAARAQLDGGVASEERVLTLDAEIERQIGRSRVYGGMAGAGGVLFIGATAVFLATLCFDCDSREARVGGAMFFLGVVGGSFLLTGAIGLLVSGLKRRHLRRTRDALQVHPLVSIEPRGGYSASLLMTTTW